MSDEVGTSTYYEYTPTMNLRFACKPGTTTESPRLQQEFNGSIFDSSHRLLRTFTEWRDVPLIIVPEPTP